ncbi:MAG TPA: helix-turn-helix domain-containing protein [Gemmatimonadaceae bacterium]
MTDLLNPKQLAEYLQLSQRTVYRLLERGGIPAVKVGGQWRFRKTAVDEWLDVNMHRLDSESLSQLEGDDDAGRKPWHIAQLIAPENARIPVPAGSRDEVVRAFIAQVHFPEAVPVDLVVARVLERERLCSTALTDGVALLHTPRSRPRVLAAHDLLAIGRLDAPVDFGALDGSQTETLVLLLARSERDQIALLAKVARLCREPGFLASLRGARGHDEAIDLIDRTEQRLFVHAN